MYTLYGLHGTKAQAALKDLLLNHLPKEYTTKVISKLSLENITVDSQTVRNTKAGIIKNIQIFNAIIEVANEHKMLSNNLKNNILKNEK